MHKPGLICSLVLGAALLCSCTVVDHYTGEDINGPIRETGIPASAKILEVWDTGVKYNDDPVVGFRLLVTPQDGSAYEAETKNVISIVHLGQFQPGAIVPVRVDPGNPKLVALDIYGGR